MQQGSNSLPLIVVFTENPDKFKEVRKYITLLKLEDADNFDLSQLKDPWSTFENTGELLSKFETL